MYEYLFRGPVRADDGRRREAVTHHQGSCLDFLQRHHDDARRALRDGVGGVRAVAP